MSNFSKALVEWNLPPLNFRRAGTPGAYLTRARASLFASGVATNLDDDALGREVANAGAQVGFRA